MDGLARSTIAALFYAKQTDLDFHGLAAKLAAAMLHNTEGGLQIHTDYDDVVIFDQADVRIGLAHAKLSDDFPEVVAAQGCDECFIVSVGDLPDNTGRQDHAEICARIAAQIEARYPADGEVVLESDVAFTEDAFDTLLDTMVSAFTETSEADSGHAAPAAAEILSPVSEIVVEPVVMAAAEDEAPKRGVEQFEPLPEDWVPSDLIARYDREIARRSDTRSAPRYGAVPRRPAAGRGSVRPAATKAKAPRPGAARAAAAFASLRPQPTHAPQSADTAGARAMARLGIRIGGLEPEPDSIFPSIEAAHKAPLVHRGAINALNVAVMAFSLPMGAFLMTLALLGRESLVMSSRVTAATGAGLGVSQSDTAMTLLQSLIS
jgi:hypothetical protein